MLADPWLESETFNELRQVPGLACEGEWSNQPLATRGVPAEPRWKPLPEAKWWSLPAFIRA